MPQYTFQCDACSLEFKRRLAMGNHPDHKCPNCSEIAPRLWDGQPLAHNFAASEGTKSANSGVSQHDYPTADNIVGRSAEMRWEMQHRRNAAKAEIRSKGVALARRDIVDANGHTSEYQSLGKESFQARKKLEGRFKQEAAVRGMSSALPAKKTQ